jgi:hypothetical protein
MAAPGWDLAQGNFAPDPASIQRVVEAFRHHGITLVIDPQHTEIPYVQYMSLGPTGDPFHTGFPCLPTVCVNFYDLKSQYFRPTGRQSWHYAIFGDRGYTINGFVGGAAELPGYNFMVTNPQKRTCFFGTLDFCQNKVPGTFMHELGHNLDLRHGGDEEQNYKLNYLSVMNYQYQIHGIPYTAPGDTYQFLRSTSGTLTSEWALAARPAARIWPFTTRVRWTCRTLVRPGSSAWRPTPSTGTTMALSSLTLLLTSTTFQTLVAICFSLP